MKNYSNKIMRLMIALIALSGSLSEAKVRVIKSRRDFEQNLSKKTMMIALFYEGQKERGKGRNDNKGLTRMYDDFSSYQPYDDADIIFVKVNTARKDLADLASLYGVTDIPAFIFFNHGKRIVNNKGEPLELHGFVSRADLQASIENCCGVTINKLVAQKKERNKQILASENESWKPYFYPRDVFVRDYSPAETHENLE
jgi:thioredoxin-related protein